MSTTTRLMEKLLVFQERQALALERIEVSLRMPPVFADGSPIEPKPRPKEIPACPKCGSTKSRRQEWCTRCGSDI